MPLARIFRKPDPLGDLLYKPKHSLIDQSLHANLGPHTTNGDGFGIGWYGEGDTPALFKGIDPVWNNRNLREISRRSGQADIRAYPCIDRHAGAADQLSSFPARQMAVDAQRPDRALSRG